MSLFEELTQCDPRTDLWHPFGSDLTKHDQHLSMLQAMIAPASLDARVPEEVRAYFETVRALFMYGYFVYEFYAVAVDYTFPACEFALRERFVEAYGGQIPLEGTAGADALLPVDSYDDVVAAFRPKGPYPYRAGWRLRGHRNFRGSFASLVEWARETGLLAHWLNAHWARLAAGVRSNIVQSGGTPQGWYEWNDETRERWWRDDFRPRWDARYAKVKSSLRNMRAHGTFRFVTTPTDAAWTINDTALFIGSLWAPGRGQGAKPSLSDSRGVG